MAEHTVDTDSEEDLPPGWEERVTIDGKIFYACHETQKTQWTHPVTGKRKRITGELPFGWEKKIGDSGYVYYVDHKTKTTTFTDPRLAFAIEDKDVAGDISALRQKFDANTSALQIVKGRDLSSKYALVTGANTGIGYETVRTLTSCGCHVVMACRNVKSGEEKRNQLLKEFPEAKIVVQALDLASLKSTYEFAKNYRANGWPLHILILNAGIFSPPYTLTEDNLELSFQVNCLSHFYLCLLFKDLLKTSSPARVIHVSSESHRFDYGPYCIRSVDDVTQEKLSPPQNLYSGMSQYGVTKLLQVAASNALNTRQVVNKVTHNSVHPGNMINTDLSRQWWAYRLLFAIVSPFTKSTQQGAATTMYVATHEDLADVGGMYFNNCWVCEPSKLASDKDFCEKVYETCERILVGKMGDKGMTV